MDFFVKPESQEEKKGQKCEVVGPGWIELEDPL